MPATATTRASAQQQNQHQHMKTSENDPTTNDGQQRTKTKTKNNNGGNRLLEGIMMAGTSLCTSASGASACGVGGGGGRSALNMTTSIDDDDNRNNNIVHRTQQQQQQDSYDDGDGGVDVGCGIVDTNNSTFATSNVCLSPRRNNKHSEQDETKPAVYDATPSGYGPYRKILQVQQPKEVPATTTTTNRSSFSQQQTSVTMQRKIGYTICEAKDFQHRKTAILWFYPLSGHSIIVESAALSCLERNYQASLISIDRPNIGDTDALLPFDRVRQDNHHDHSLSSSAAAVQINNTNNPSIERIQGHADDVLTVLQYHGIENVYLLAVCLGHVYSIEIARRLLHHHHQQQYSAETNNANADDAVNGGSSANTTTATTTTTATATTTRRLPKLKGIALVAPFVSTACPYSWSVAKLGSRVPNFVLRAATYTLTSIGGMLMSSYISPERVSKILSESERQQFGWEEQDYEDVCTNVRRMHTLTLYAKAPEANLGADPSWQCICDAFAIESGYGLRIDDDDEDEHYRDYGDPKGSMESEGRNHAAGASVHSSKVPIVIYASLNDRLANLQSIEWVARRCYGDSSRGSCIEIQHDMRSHEIMTLLGGPPRNPGLLHRIVQDQWGLCKTKT